MVSEEAKAYLKERFGDQYFGWDISDTQVKEILKENRNITYAALNEECTKLEKLIKEIEEMLKVMYESV